MKPVPVSRNRRHTLYLCEEVRAAAPVFLDTEVDMTGVTGHRSASARRYSVVAYVLQAAGRVLTAHPEANAAIRGRRRPRVLRYAGVSGKLTLDKRLGTDRVVLATVVPDLHTATLDTIQDRIDHFRDGDAATMEEFAAVRALHRLPTPLGRALFRLTTRPLRRRPELLGTVAVTSLGHRPVDGFQSVGGTTITLGVGRIADRPVVRHGQIVVAPVMRLSLAFDHRVIDGAEAADVLSELKDHLEGGPADPHPAGAADSVTRP
ncbi:2-oxo acid dehydrogenase subunit E2 [Micromonospora sp. NPDC048898]|uniref:2-oxo acid dehydrogenase subunit E2 n=1 Tax=Micromonospora sp. NPDC048898 TaxID=3364260 RepID=UPI00371162A7